MAWPTRNNPSMPEAAFSWPNPELENWSTEYLNFKQSEALFRPHSPAYTARYPSYNYQQFPSSQFPSTPVPFGTVMSPTPSSYLDPTTMKQSIDNPSPRSVPTPAIGTGPALSPASLYGARCPSPWDEPPVSTPMTETPPSDDTSNGVSYTKMPHRSCRRAVRIKDKDRDDYGTFKCEWRDCRYGRLFSRKGVLMRHIETQHVSPRAYKCPHPRCDHASSRRENLKAHRQSIHGETL